MLGGDITVTSVAAEGSTFVLAVPNKPVVEDVCLPHLRDACLDSASSLD